MRPDINSKGPALRIQQEMLYSATSQMEPASLPDWIMAVGTTIAFIVAALAYFDDVRHRAVAQARLIYLTEDRTTHLEPGERITESAGDAMASGDVLIDYIKQTRVHSTVEIKEHGQLTELTAHNVSNELVTRFEVQAVDFKGTRYAQIIYGGFCPLPPETSHKVRVLIGHESSIGIGEKHLPFFEVQFEDSSGRWWRRHPDGPIKRLRKRERTRAKRAWWAVRDFSLRTYYRAAAPIHRWRWTQANRTDAGVHDSRQ